MKILAVAMATLMVLGCGKAEKPLTKLEVKYQKPFQYIGKSVSDVSSILGADSNGAGNFLINTNNHSFLLESKNNTVSYVEVDFNETAPCNQKKDFDSKPLLLGSGINPESLEMARKQTHFHTYYDHANKLKIGVSCSFDGGPLNISFSKKYYGL